jgi:hypothetical protein
MAVWMISLKGRRKSVIPYFRKVFVAGIEQPQNISIKTAGPLAGKSASKLIFLQVLKPDSEGN